MTATATRLSFFAAGKPQTKGSLRFWHRWRADGHCSTGVTEQIGEPLTEWRSVVGAAARRALRESPAFTGPLIVGLTFYFERPQSNKDAGSYVYGNKRHDIDSVTVEGLT
jgi:hypothetical protein